MDKKADKNFVRGYYCAVAALLRNEGSITTAVKDLFGAGGDPMGADDLDIEIFREFGLLPCDPQKMEKG